MYIFGNRKMGDKKAVFFSTDVLIALIVIFLGILIIFPLIKYPHHESFVQKDFLKILYSLKTGEINNSYVQQLITENKITDLNKSVLEQIGEFYVTNITIAKQLAESILSELETSENMGIWYGTRLLASTNTTPLENAEEVEVERLVISGIREGESVTGFSARAYFLSESQTEYFYFGGYTGEGNLSATMDFDGNITTIEVELTINKDFDVYINDIFSGHYENSTSDFTPAKYNLEAYSNNFIAGTNIIKFAGDNLHISGGYIKLNYENGGYEQQSKRKYFSGIEGLINIYDGFYIPGVLNEMKIFLHMKSNFMTFLTIGNTSIFRGNTDGEENFTISNVQLQALLDYNNIVNQTIPLRLGLENASYVGLDVDIDSILVTDVSGSMEWCSEDDETEYSRGTWEEDGKVFCGYRRYLNKQCYPQKIKLAKEAEKAFTFAMLVNNGPRVGISEYSSGSSATIIDTDLTTTLYIGPNPNCYEPDWHEEDYDDSTWEDYNPYIIPYNLDDCDYCRAFFRKSFQIDDLSEIKYLQLYLYSDNGNVCFINGKEIGNYYNSGWQTYNIPKTILNQGENTLACSVQDYTGYFRFLPKLYTDKEDLTPEKTPVPPLSNDPNKVLQYSFNDYSDLTKDSSSYNNDGTTYNNPEWKFNGSAYFPGSSNYIRTPNSPELQIIGDLTLEFWINPDGYLGSGNQYPLYKNSGKEFYLILEDSNEKGAMKFYQKSFSWFAFDTGTIKDYEWQHIVVTRDSSTKTIRSYYNGVLNKSAIYSTNPQTSTNDIIIGNYFRGRMDEVGIYNRVLEPSEIQSHYNAASYTPNPWKMKTVYSCGSSYDPKYTRARRNIETDFTLLATVKNSGPTITTPFNVSFYKDSVSPANIIASTMVDGLEPFELKQARANWVSTISSNTRIYVNVDNSNIVLESSESNNQANLWIYPYDFTGKDLSVTDIAFSPSTLCSWQPQTYTITATVKNIGGINIPETFNVNFYKNSIASENLIGTAEITGLTAGIDIDKSINWYADLSEATPIIAYVDYDNTISEGSETNNDRTETLDIRLPDLRAHYSWISWNQPVCSLGSQNANVRIISYNYHCPAGATDVAASLVQGDWSNSNPITASVGYIYEYFNIPITITDFQTPFKVYTMIDTEDVVEEPIGGYSNEANQNLYAGPNLYFYEGITVTPNPVLENTLTDFTISSKIRNTQCGPASFKFGYYEDSVAPENLIYTEDITLTSTEVYTVETTWQASLSDDKTIYGVIDYNDEIAENSESNTASVVIDATDTIIGASIFPFYSIKELNPLIQEFLSITSSCTGTSTNLFSPNTNIVRTHELSNDEESLYSFIDKTETWWNTCICCGINKARDMLVDSESPNKFIVVMSDGEANVRCSEQGTGSATQDAIQAACDAFNDHGITVYSVGFGSDIDETTLELIATCGNGSYYQGDVNDLIQIYSQIAGEIIEASYTEQTIKGRGGITTILYPDSYIEFNYTTTEPPYGLRINGETKFTDSTKGSFNLPTNSTILETNIISYSGPRWTNNVKINNLSVYNLTNYGSNYIELGDPYSINIPNSLINNSNLIELTTGLAPENSSGGSEENKIIYKIIKDMNSYSSISASADGCIWSLEFEDSTNLTINVPNNYSGEERCYYESEQKSYNSNDAIQTAVYNLLKLLDFNSNNRLDVKFTEQDLDISSSEITGIPYGWSTEVQVIKWY